MVLAVACVGVMCYNVHSLQIWMKQNRRLSCAVFRRIKESGYTCTCIWSDNFTEIDVKIRKIWESYMNALGRRLEAHSER